MWSLTGATIQASEFRLFLLLTITVTFVLGQFQWQTRDSFDEVRKKLDKVNYDNCKIVDRNGLFLTSSAVTHVPDLKWLGIDPVYPNRTGLLHVHNMALARAFYFSFILQKAGDEQEPGFMYYFLSTISDVAANKWINASSIYYGPHLAFTPSYKGFYNKTMPLFGPRAYRADDFNDPYHLQGTSTLNTIEVVDMGAIPNNSVSLNYTHEQFKINEWYTSWLPDTTKRHDSKTTYTVQITYANGTGETFVWHGPPAASDTIGPVKWIKPYFDCERSNKWVYGATVPIPDIFPRHTGWRHIEIPIYVAASVMEIDFEKLDINQCPLGEGNPAPNYFAGTSRCKNSTTECEPLHGFGFRRGGYQCRCRPGYRLPRVVRSPFLGEEVERASEREREKGYTCDRIGYMGVKTQNPQPATLYDRALMMGKMETITGLDPNGNITSPKSNHLDPNWVVNYIRNVVNRKTCEQVYRESPDKLKLSGDISYGKEQQLENQARMALRLANFISSFLQLVNPKEMFAEFRVPDKSLTEDQIIGEALSIVIGDRKIYGCGVIFDRGQFPNRTHFAPYAYRTERNSRTFYVDDLSRNRKNKDKKHDYLKRDYFEQLRGRWKGGNYDDLEVYTAKINIRYNSSGLYGIKYDHYPLQYKAAEMRHGFWTVPYHDCHGFHKEWILTYAVPFFGWDAIQSRLEMKGVVSVSMHLDELDVNQCSDDYDVKNAFKGSHKCDRRSTRCIPILGRKYDSGGYKCECEQGFEYPYNDPFTYFDGQILEAEYDNMRDNKPTRFDTLSCRVAAGAMIRPFKFMVVMMVIILMVVTRQGVM